MSLTCEATGATLEIASDLVGFVAAVLFSIPAVYSALGKDRVESLRVRIRNMVGPESTKVDLEAQLSKHAGIGHNPNEKAQLVWGAGLLVLSFGLKLVFHAVTKHWICQGA